MKVSTASLLLGLLLAFGAGTASAKLRNIENAYEGDIRSVTLPDNASGQVVVRECPTCKPVVLRVSNSTRYYVGLPSSAPVSLQRLRKAAAAAGGERLLTVFYSLETNVVTRIVLGAN